MCFATRIGHRRKWGAIVSLDPGAVKAEVCLRVRVLVHLVGDRSGKLVADLSIDVLGADAANLIGCDNASAVVS